MPRIPTQPRPLVRVSTALLLSIPFSIGPAVAQTATPFGDSDTSLKTIIVRFWAYLGGRSPADTGTTVLDTGQYRARTDGSGDANSFLRGLPNVQYQNDTDDDAGMDGQKEINLRPSQYRISGGRTYENNFILDGMGINTITGTEERHGSEELTSDEDTPNADRMYGLHPQTVFVPADFVDSAIVIDSNASAQYGSFLGGIVSYKLAQPKTDRWHYSTSINYQSDDMVHYKLATEDGLNPLDRTHPEFIKRKTSYSATGPITDNISIIGQYSLENAATTKQKNYIYGNDTIDEKSKNEFFRLQANADTDYGDFILEGVYTKYHQDFESVGWRDMELDTGTRSFASKLENDYDAGDFTFAGVPLQNVHLKSKLSYSRGNTINTSNSDTAYAYTQSELTSKVVQWESSEMTDWCRTDPTKTTSTVCREGGYGNKEQGQEQFGFSQSVSGEIGAGTFNAGYEVQHTEANRARLHDFTYYTSTTTIWDSRALGVPGFTCNTTEVCSAEQFASIKSVWRAFDVTAKLNAANAYAELDQTWDWFSVRAGVRAEFDDYQKNFNISPRLVTTITPLDGISFSGGYNRYYDGQSLAYAVREIQPRAQSYTRKVSSAGVVGDTWTIGTLTGNYVNSVADIDTPYVDEFTAGITIKDTFTDGQWRFRYMNRQLRDQYATENLGKNVYALTNSATGAYQSATAEYAKEWAVAGIDNLETLTLSASITWSKQQRSADSYFTDEDDLLDPIYYKGRSYTLGGFSVVTGNQDIPVRAQIAVDSVWMDGRLNLGMAMNYNFAYKGAGDTGDTIVVDGINHDLWEVRDFKPVLTVDVGGAYTVAKKDDASLAVNFKVTNVFDETGNALAGTSNPWVRGRAFWLGASATF